MYIASGGASGRAGGGASGGAIVDGAMVMVAKIMAHGAAPLPEWRALDSRRPTAGNKEQVLDLQRIMTAEKTETEQAEQTEQTETKQAEQAE